MSRKTEDINDKKYSKDVIRQYEDPEYARAAEEYERRARREKAMHQGRSFGSSSDEGRSGSSYGSRSGSSYGGRSSGPSYGDGRRAEGPPYGDVGNAYGSFNSDGYSERERFDSGRSGGPGTERISRREQRKRAKAAERAAEKQRRRAEKRGKGRGVKRFFRIVLILILVLVVAFAGLLVSASKKADFVDTSGEDFAIDPTAEAELKGFRNIAILGVDNGSGSGYDGARSDAILIMSIDRKNGDIRMISVMRDSYLKLKGYYGTLTYDKITHAHAFGGGVNTCAALNRCLDLNITEYVIFNWKAVADAVDAIGGITVDVKEDEIRDMNKYGVGTQQVVGRTYTPIQAAGEQKLDGVQAATYCRIRETSGGDEGRTKRFKIVVSACMKKVLTQPFRVPKLMNTVMPEIRTNLTTTDFLTLGFRAPGYSIVGSAGWPYDYADAYIGGVYYAVPRTLESNVTSLHQKVFGDSGYTPSDTVRSISSDILYRSGIR